MFTYHRLSPVAIPQSEAGSAALERGRLHGFGLGARPAPRLRSWSEAGSTASVLERGRLRGFGLGVAFRPLGEVSS